MSATAGAISGGSTAHPELARETEPGPSNESLGIILFIVSEAVMFGAFFAQYFYNRILSDGWPTRTAERRFHGRAVSFHPAALAPACKARSPTPVFRECLEDCPTGRLPVTPAALGPGGRGC